MTNTVFALSLETVQLCGTTFISTIATELYTHTVDKCFYNFLTPHWQTHLLTYIVWLGKVNEGHLFT